MTYSAQHRPRHRDSWWRILVVSLFAAVALGLVVYTAAYADRVLPGRSIGGTSIAGMTREQVEQFVDQRIRTAKITVRVNGNDMTLPFADAGIIIDPAAVAASAMNGSGNILASVASLTALVRSDNITVPASIDDSLFSAVAARADTLTGSAPVGARVVLSEDESTHVAVAGRDGMAVDRQALRSGFMSAATALSDYSIELSASPSSPEVTTEEAERAATQADDLVREEIALVGPTETFTADTATKAGWVNFDETDGSLTPTINEEQVRSWVDSTVARVNRDPINGINNVDSRGSVLQLARPAKEGRSVTNADALTHGILDALRSRTAYSGTIEWDPIEASMEDRVVPSGPERFAYRAKAGEKWVEVNLTDSTLTAYRGQEVVHGPILINHGGVGHETVTGTYRVYLKLTTQDMGCTPDWPYCERNVPWVAYWHKDYALHGAPWVKEFGIGTDESSHGCINIPVEDAHWIHDFVDIGTVVVSHY
ncbi:L,D-transpeptidase family protein [Actinomyces mediterranea]|uniref:L,D-transpeptidase family protein n=1 Tax=Actinomyces mediterranea TaxID=1871028 RepID=UPI0009FA7FBC|nr:L,D-transpeptidase [Actinomyces mediterranea]